MPAFKSGDVVVGQVRKGGHEWKGVVDEAHPTFIVIVPLDKTGVPIQRRITVSVTLARHAHGFVHGCRADGTTTCCNAFTSIFEDGTEYCRACFNEVTHI